MSALAAPRCSAHRGAPLFPKACPVCRRIELEADVVTRVVDALLAAGAVLAVNDDDVGALRPAVPTTDSRPSAWTWPTR